MEFKVNKPSNFTPFSITIDVNSKRGFELLLSLTNNSRDNLVAFLNAGASSQSIPEFNSDEKDTKQFQELWELLEKVRSK
jgi:hypothetical protein